MANPNADYPAPVIRPRNRTPLIYWLLSGFLVLMLLLAWFLAYLLSDRVIANLGKQPLTGFMNGFATSTDLRGHCATQFWRLSDKSREIVSAQGLKSLAPPHRADPGFEPASWRAAREIDAGALPWNARKCPEPDRLDFLALASAPRSVVAVMRGAPSRGTPDRALFLLDLEDGVFARAVFSGEAVARLDAHSDQEK